MRGLPTDRPIQLPSPALLPAPLHVSEATLLRQSLALLLTEKVLAERSRSLATYGGELNWVALLSALRLWQIWQRDDPLAVGQEDLAHWLFVEIPQTRKPDKMPLPHAYVSICATFRLWNLAPAALAIPLLCSDLDPPFIYPQRSPVKLRRLAQHLPTRLDGPIGHESVAPLGELVILATLIDYMATAYGREQVAALFHALPAHRNWDTLIPAVFGLSVAEFETGWHRYLAEEYGVAIS